MRDIKAEETHLLDLEEAGLSREQLAESLAADFVEGLIDKQTLEGLVPYFGAEFFAGLEGKDEEVLKAAIKERLSA